MVIVNVTVGTEKGLAIEAQNKGEAETIREVFRDGDIGFVTCHESKQHQYPVLMVKKEKP